MNKTQIALLIPSALLLILGIYFLWEAYNLSSDYQWALNIRIPPMEFYEAVILPIVERYERFFYTFFLIGCLFVASGSLVLILSVAIIGRKRKY